METFFWIFLAEFCLCLPDFCPEFCRKWSEMGYLGVGIHPEQVSGRVVDSRADFEDF